MTSIHPFAYMIIGVVVSGYSKFIEWKNPESYLGPFFWIGLILIAWGLIKLLFRKMNKESEKKEEESNKQFEHVERGFNEAHRPFQGNHDNYQNNQQINQGPRNN